MLLWRAATRPLELGNQVCLDNNVKMLWNRMFLFLFFSCPQMSRRGREGMQNFRTALPGWWCCPSAPALLG